MVALENEKRKKKTKLPWETADLKKKLRQISSLIEEGDKDDGAEDSDGLKVEVDEAAGYSFDKEVGEDEEESKGSEM